MRVAAILGPRVRAGTVERFAAPGVELEKVAGFRELPEGAWDAVLVFGGDGTVHLHLRELHERGIPMLVVPVGSGNDFADALGIGSVSAAEAVWRQFCGGSGNVKKIDLGEITTCSPRRAQGTQRESNAGPSTARGQDSRAALGMTNPCDAKDCLNAEGAEERGGKRTLFGCIGGAGLDAETNRRANAMPRWLRGHGGYALAAVAEMARWTPVAMEVEISGPSGQRADRKSLDTKRTEDMEGAAESEVLTGAATLVAFANASSYGHGMKMAPRALLDDGQLDVCFVRQTTTRRLLTFFPSVFSGGHLALPEVEYRQTGWLRVETERPMAVYADGEYVCETPVEVRVMPRALKVIVRKLSSSGDRVIGSSRHRKCSATGARSG